MDKGICLLGAVPVRQNPDDKSTMETQLIWGESFLILERTKKWLNVQSHHDHFEGWIPENQVFYLTDEQFEALSTSKPVRAASLFNYVTEIITGKKYIIPAGSDLYNYDDGEFSVLWHKFKYDGTVINNRNVKNPAEYAILFLNAPYLFGGRTAMGIDCPGLVQIAYKMAGISISRNAFQQSREGKLVHFHHDTQPGDLMFFDENEGSITHAGIVFERGLIIHVNGKVRIDSFDQQGIYDVEKKKYTHQLRLIKRIPLRQEL